MTNKEYFQKYYKQHKEELNKYKQDWYKINKKKHQSKCKEYYIKNKEVLSKKNKMWYQKNKYKIAIKSRSEGRSGKKIPLDLQFAMNRVRIRDNNTCQWYGCGLKHKVTEIHVHHIFPRKEYPELELNESYMICYCAEHHGQFHAARGDYYHKMIKDQRKLIPNAEIICNKFENIGGSD